MKSPKTQIFHGRRVADRLEGVLNLAFADIEGSTEVVNIDRSRLMLAQEVIRSKKDLSM